MFVALFAALMSSVDSTLSSSSTIWTNDIIGRIRHLLTGKDLDERTGLIMGRVLTIVFIVTAAICAPFVQNIEKLYEFSQTLLSLFQGPTLAILFLGIMWRRANQWGGLAGLVGGMLIAFVLNNVDGLFVSSDPFLFVSWWSFVFSLILTIVVSLMTTPDPDDKVRGLVWGSVMQDDDAQDVLKDRVAE